MSKDISINALEQGRRAIEATAGNVARAAVGGAHAIDRIQTTRVGGGQFLGLNSELVRKENAYLTQQVRESVAQDSQNSVIKRSLNILQSTSLGDPSEAAKSELVLKVNSFLSKAGLLVTNHDISLTQAFVSEGQTLATTISNAASKVNELRFGADQELSASLGQANGIIKQLFDLNQGINTNSTSAIQLLDTRDKLLNELAKHFDIKVNFGHNGTALVRSTNGGTNILDQSSYVQFSYTGLVSEEAMVQGAAINPVTTNLYGTNGSMLTTNIQAIGGSASPGFFQISGGNIAGFIELRDNLLPASLNAISALGKLVADKVNAIHNNGSPYPPKTTYTGSNQVSLSSGTTWSGTNTVTVVGLDGRAINGRPFTIDLGSIASPLNNGVTTVADVITELNALLNTGPSAQRIALGQINDNTNAPIAGQFLLNDVKLAGKSNIDAAGNFTFDLELDGSNYFGSTIEILDVQTGPTGVGPYVPIPANLLPDSFRLDKSTHTRTNQPITVGGIIGVPQQDIRVKIRVIGDNGMVQTGTVAFIVDPAVTNRLNQRVVGAIPNPVIPGNNIAQQGITHASYATAKLVDSNGTPIAPTDLYTTGSLVIESIGNQYGLVFNDGASTDLGNLQSGTSATNYGFSHFFGLNNFFEVDSKHNTMSVREDIATNVANLSAAIPSQDAGVITNVNVGLAAANATMQFAAGGALTAGDTITIDGTVYTFANVIVNPNDVLTGANLVASLQNLTDKINTTDSLSSILSAAFDGVNTITITAKATGISGNNIQVAAALGLGETVDINAAGAAQNYVATPFAGGTDQAQALTVYSLAIGPGSVQVFQNLANLSNAVLSIPASGNIPATNASLHGYASIISGVLANQISSADTSFGVSNKVLETLNNRLKEETGVDKWTELERLIEENQYLQANISVASMVQKSTQRVLDMITAN